MGTIFRPNYRDRHGTLQTSTIWWARFRQHGRPVKVSTGTASESKAKAVLREKEGRVALHLPVVPQADRLTLAQAGALIRQDYTANGRKSLPTLEHRLAHVLADFGPATRLSRLSTAAVEAYKARRLAAGAAPGTLNRELAALGRMAALARHQLGLAVPFVVTMLAERNVRTGFFDEDAFARIGAALRPDLAALAHAAYLTGWRKSELRSRQWRHVDLAAGWLRLDPEETKNRDGRMFPLIPALRAVLEAQRGRVDAIQRTTGRVVPWVFCRDDGAPVGDFKRAWRTACVAAGFFRVVPVLAADGTPRRRKDGTPVVRKLPTKLVHDFRRTAVRNLLRAGIPGEVAMKLTGHRTRAVFQRYAIVEESMLLEAGAKLTAAATREPADRPGGRVAALSPEHGAKTAPKRAKTAPASLTRARS